MNISKLRYFVFSLLLGLSLLLTSATSAKTDNEIVNWNFIDVRIPLNKINPNLELVETFSYRFVNEFERADVNLFRSELLYHLNKNIDTSLGYDYFIIYNNSNNHENRFWQQLLLKKNNKRSIPYNRTRVEERLISQVEPNIRLRNKLGYIYTINDVTNIDLSDEIFINFPHNAGLEQNRINITVNRKINQYLTLGIGYQLQHFYQDRNLLNHSLISKIQISL